MKNLLLILLSAMLFSCGEEKKEEAVPVPDEIVEDEKMVDVLVDLHLIEASLSLNMLEDQRAARDTSEFYDPYKKHNVPKKAFDESFQYYASKPEALNAIYEEVMNRINLKQAEVMKNIPKDSTAKSSRPKTNLPGGGPKFRPGMGPQGPPKQ